MTDIEAVARAYAKAVEGSEPPAERTWRPEHLRGLQAVIDTLKSLGWRTPAEMQEIAQAAEARGLERAAREADIKAAEYEGEQEQDWQCSKPIAVRLRGLAQAIRALKPDAGEWKRVSEGLECVAWQECDHELQLDYWIAATVDHDVMAQGDTFEHAKERLEAAIALDKLGLATKGNPVVKTFRAMIAGEKP